MGHDGPVHDDYRFATLARRLAQAPGSESTTALIVDLAVETIGCTGAAITTLTPNGHLQVIDASDTNMLATAADIADRTGHSATKSVLTDKATVVNNDVAGAPMWGDYSAQIVDQTPIRSTASFYLSLTDVELGVMSFYHDRPGFFTDSVVADCVLYADHAAVALKTARAEDRSTQLASAVDSNREIGIAIGIVMTRYQLTRQGAFDMLVVASSHLNRKLRDIATETADTGDIPPWS